MQADRGKPTLIKDNEESVLDRAPPRTPNRVSSGGGFHRRIQHGCFTGTAQAAGEFHVFHQGNGSKTAQRPEGFAPNENGLVAKKTSATASEETRQPFEPEEPRMSPVELAIKGATNDRGSAQSKLDRRQMRCR